MYLRDLVWEGCPVDDARVQGDLHHAGLDTSTGWLTFSFIFWDQYRYIISFIYKRSIG